MKNMILTGIFLLGSFLMLQAQDHSGHNHNHATKDEKKAACCEKVAETPACCAKPTEGSAHTEHQMEESKIPNVVLKNQFGEVVNIRELMADKLVAMNFIFTTCTTICPPMGANFVNLKERVQDHLDKDLVMISVSIDPVTDTPERLKAWSDKFNPGEGWTLLTGNRETVDHLLKSLKVFTPLIEDHAPILMVGRLNENDWLRTNGLASPDQLAKLINERLEQSETTTQASKKDIEDSSRNYFTDTKLLNQHGEEMLFYTDLLKDKIVIINPFFADCTGSCPAMHASLQRVQDHLGDKMGKEVHIISVTVDSENDTPEKLAEYAKRFNAGKGWYFLSGESENVGIVLQKLGKAVTFREEHDAILLVGNLSTLLWKKVNGLAPIGDIIPIVDSVINDEG